MVRGNPKCQVRRLREVIHELITKDSPVYIQWNLKWRRATAPIDLPLLEKAPITVQTESHHVEVQRLLRITCLLVSIVSIHRFSSEFLQISQSYGFHGNMDASYLQLLSFECTDIRCAGNLIQCFSIILRSDLSKYKYRDNPLMIPHWMLTVLLFVSMIVLAHHSLLLPLFKMVIDSLPSWIKGVFGFIDSINVRFIQLAAVNQVLAFLNHRVNFWLILLYFIKEELWVTSTCIVRWQSQRQTNKLLWLCIRYTLGPCRCYPTNSIFWFIFDCVVVLAATKKGLLLYTEIYYFIFNNLAKFW